MERPPWRELTVPEVAAGMRLDRFLTVRFPDRSRSWFGARIRAGEVEDASGRPLAASHRVIAAEVLRLHVEGIAPSVAAPPFPTILWEGSDVVAVDKPAGLLSHPAGTRFTWALVTLAKERWAQDRVDLVHRLDRDTSGVMLLTRALEANRFLKRAMKAGAVHKEYEALVKGEVSWDRQIIEAPIGPAQGPIRIQMAVRADGQPARTEVVVLGRRSGVSRVRCTLHTGRTHQIRVHLAHVGHGILGDRLYGVPSDVFLDIWEHGLSEAALRRAGAPRHALHAARTTFPTLDGAQVEVEAPFAQDLESLWANPSDPFGDSR